MIISDIDHGRLSWLIPRAASSSNFSVNNSIGPQHAKKPTHQQVVCLERGRCLSDDSKRECVPLILSTNVKQNLEAFFLPTSTTLHLGNSRGYLPFLFFCLPSLKMPKIISYRPASVTFHPNFDKFNCFASLFEIIFEILTAG